MSHQLLTGATGLLGRYLLWNCLGEGRPLVLLVRSTRVEPARQRIESILARWELDLGYALPRPPVLAGDICQPGLGLGDADRAWVKANCSSVMHSAASLSFTEDPKTGEPDRSNVGGTQHVLEFCRDVGIREFHHISTSFVAGLRSGRVMEDELDVGQQWGNPYEVSKVKAEKLVRAADYLDSPTIYRPATIIGDSKTGFANTFHGFYAPIQIGKMLIDRIKPPGITEELSQAMQSAWGLSGDERKNFVPVDWVAQVIAFISGRPEFRGGCYALALDSPVRVDISSEAMKVALDEYARSAYSSGMNPLNTDELYQLQSVFRDQMEIYRSHWRNDPEFDSTNTRRAAPHLTPPAVDDEMLLRTSRYALRTNFCWPRPKPLRPEFDVESHLETIASRMPSHMVSPDDRLGLQVNGPGGGQWTLAIPNGHLSGLDLGLDDDTVARVYLNSRLFQQLVLGQLTAEQAMASGQLNAELGSFSNDRMAAALQAITTSGMPTSSS